MFSLSIYCYVAKSTIDANSAMHDITVFDHSRINRSFGKGLGRICGLIYLFLFFKSHISQRRIVSVIFSVDCLSFRSCDNRNPKRDWFEAEVQFTRWYREATEGVADVASGRQSLCEKKKRCIFRGFWGLSRVAASRSTWPAFESLTWSLRRDGSRQKRKIAKKGDKW